MEGLFGTILVSGIILAVVILIIGRMVKNKKEGKRGCAMGCSGCSQRQSCFVINDNFDFSEEAPEDPREIKQAEKTKESQG